MWFVNRDRKAVGKEETKMKRLYDSNCTNMTREMQGSLVQSYKSNNEEDNRHNISPNVKVEVNASMHR